MAKAVNYGTSKRLRSPPTAGSHKLHKNKKSPTKSDNLITNFYVNQPTEHAKEKACALVGTTTTLHYI